MRTGHSIANRGGLALLLLATTILAGCVTTAGTARFVESDTACGPQRQTLASLQDTFAEDLVSGIIAGAALGALTAAVTDGNIARGALIGAGLGAAAGAYLNSLKKQHAGNLDGLLIQIDGDLSRENREIARAQAAFDSLIACRKAEAKRIRDDHAAGRLDVNAANVALAAVRMKLQDDFGMAERVREGMTKRGQGFEETYQFIDPAGYSGSIATAVWTPPPPAAPPVSFRVATTGANVRAEPSAQATRVGGLGSGERVQVEGLADGWYKVRMSNGTVGYVAERLLAEDGSAAAKAAQAPKPAAPKKPVVPPGTVPAGLTTLASETGTAAPVGEAQVGKVNKIGELTLTNRLSRQQYENSVQTAKADTELASLTQDIGAGQRISRATVPTQVALIAH